MRDLHNKIINSIPSNSLKEVIRKEGFSVSEIDLVYIVDNYVTNFNEKVRYLNELFVKCTQTLAKEKIQKILLEINNLDDPGEYCSYLWEESEISECDGVCFSLITKEYKPTWPQFLNKYDLVKIKPYFDPANYHYGILLHFQNQVKGPKASVFLFEDVRDEDLNAIEEYEGIKYYVIPENYAHEHILFELIEKVDLNEAPKDIKELYLKIIKTISNRVDIGKYIHSPILRERLKGHEFSDMEKANIINLAIYPFSEKIKDLDELRHYTTNYKLYKELSLYLDSLENVLENLKVVNENELYEVMDIYNSKYYFNNYEEAYKKGMEFDNYFQIKKIKIGNEYYKSYIYSFDNKGELIWTNFDLMAGYDDESFIECYVNLPNVFIEDSYRVVKRFFPIPEFVSDEYMIMVKDQKKQFDFRNDLLKRKNKLDGSCSGPYIYIISNDFEIWEEPYIDFVNMHYIDEKEITLAMIQDIEFLKRK